MWTAYAASTFQIVGSDSFFLHLQTHCMAHHTHTYTDVITAWVDLIDSLISAGVRSEKLPKNPIYLSKYGTYVRTTTTTFAASPMCICLHSSYIPLVRYHADRHQKKWLVIFLFSFAINFAWSVHERERKKNRKFNYFQSLVGCQLLRAATASFLLPFSVHLLCRRAIYHTESG